MGLLMWQEADSSSLKELAEWRDRLQREITILNFIMNKKIRDEVITDKEENMLCAFENGHIDKLGATQ